MRSDISALAMTVLLLASGAGASIARPKIMTLPRETSALKETSEPGYALAANACVVCHSVDYITTQPPGKGKDFWAAEVTKMIDVYGATVQDADRPAIIDYLAHNY